MSKIIDCSRHVKPYEFQDLLGSLQVLHITSCNEYYDSYKKHVVDNNDNVLLIVDLIKCIHITDEVNYTDIISVIIYKSGTCTYIACY